MKDIYDQILIVSATINAYPFQK